MWKVLLYYQYTSCLKKGLSFFLQADEVGFLVNIESLTTIGSVRPLNIQYGTEYVLYIKTNAEHKTVAPLVITKSSR